MDQTQAHSNNGIFVAGLPVYSSKSKLAEIFGCFGQIKFIRIFSKKAGKKTQSFAKIRYADPQVHEEILKSSALITYEGKPISITELQPPSKTCKVQIAAHQSNENLIVIQNIPQNITKA
jgi:hypothetical protein